jgi:hypothetical protein
MTKVNSFPMLVFIADAVRYKLWMGYSSESTIERGKIATSGVLRIRVRCSSYNRRSSCDQHRICGECYHNEHCAAHQRLQEQDGAVCPSLSGLSLQHGVAVLELPPPLLHFPVAVGPLGGPLLLLRVIAAGRLIQLI